VKNYLKMNYIKYNLRLIKNLIFENPIKSIFIVLMIISYSFAGTFNNTKKSFTIKSKIEIDSINYYVIQFIENNKIKHKLYKQEDDTHIENNHIIIYDYHELNIILYIFSITFLILTIIGLLVEDKWDLRRIRSVTFNDFIITEYENNLYNYIIFNRCIYTSVYLNSYRDVSHHIRKYSDLKHYPIYYTKKDKIKKNLKSLL
jgi:hypothetical protein